MADQFVKMAPDVTGASQKYDAINLLAAIGRFALPNAWPPLQLERDLEARFSAAQALTFTDVQGWLNDCGIKQQSISSALVSAANDEPEPLHALLQQLNNDGALPFLQVTDASKLVELEDNADGSGAQTHPLWSKSEPCLLLRVGYNTDSNQAYAYYHASLPGDSRRLVKITWPSVVAARPNAGVAILPPPAALDMDTINQAVHIMQQALTTANQALATANQAHATIQASLGQTPIPAAAPEAS